MEVIEEGGGYRLMALWDAHEILLYNTRQECCLVSYCKVSLLAVNKMEAGSQRSAGRRGRGKSENYSRFIYKVLKQGPEVQGVCLSRESDLMLSIASEAARLSLYNKRRTITRREVESAVKNITTSGPSTRPLPGSAASD